MGISVAFALAGCGGQANEGSGDADSTGSTAITDQGGSAGSATPGGTSNANVPATTIGGSGGFPGGLAACEQTEALSASAKISDADGPAKAGTDGKQRVTVAKLEEAPLYENAPAARTTLHYTLHGATQDWSLDATVPGLTSQLIKVGDVLDFQLETSPGYIPLTQAYNQVLGLFSTDGELLLFGADMIGYTLSPDLSFLDLEVSDSGEACGSGSTDGGGCQYKVSTAHFSGAGTGLDLQPGQTGQLGNLLIGLQTYRAVVGSGGACDDSGRSTMAGVRNVLTNK